MVAQKDSSNNVGEPRAYLRHGASTLTILKPPPHANFSHRQRLQRSPKALLQRKALVQTNMCNVQRHRGIGERSIANATNDTNSHPCYDMTTSPSSAPLHTLQPPFNSAETLAKLMILTASNDVSCEYLLRFTRTRLRFDSMLYDLRPEFRTRLWLAGDEVRGQILCATRKFLDGVGEQIAANEVYKTLCNIGDPVCQFLCCSMLFVDCVRDPFFTALDLDKLINVISPQSLPFVTRIISFITPPVQSFSMSPVCEQFFPATVDSLTAMLRATARSIRQLTVYLPDDQMVEVLQNAAFPLAALEELCVKVRGERIREYNQPEATKAIHGLFERVSSMCPKLRSISLQNAGVGSAPFVNIERLPASVDHIVSVRDVDLLQSFVCCVGLRTITIQVANIDFQKFVLFERGGGFQQLERVNLVNCVFEPSNANAKLDHISPRLRKCIRTIANDPLDTVPYFPVEGLPLLIGDLPFLEVLDLNLNTEADYYICETLGYVVESLPFLKSFSLQVLETRLHNENVGNFKGLFRCLMKSKCAMEHLRMANMWVSTDVLHPFLERKGASLKTLDVKVHSGCCPDEETGLVLSGMDVVEVLRKLSRCCPKIANVCIGEKQQLQRVLTAKGGWFDRGILRSQGDGVNRIWEDLVLRFDRVKASCEAYQDAMRDVLKGSG